MEGDAKRLEMRQRERKLKCDKRGKRGGGWKLKEGEGEGNKNLWFDTDCFVNLPGGGIPPFCNINSPGTGVNTFYCKLLCCCLQILTQYFKMPC